MQSKQHTYTSVSEQRGVKRLWLQGLRLNDCGFAKGERYRVDFEFDRGLVHLVKDAHGDRVVSGRKRGDHIEPIVDICNASVGRFTGDATRVRADFYAGRITFSISHRDEKRREREQRFRHEVEQGRLTEGVVCSGIGVSAEAMHEGFARMGVQCSLSWVVDRDRRYIQASMQNARCVDDETQLFEASLEELEPELLSPVSVLQASLPCTGHSRAGKSKNKIDLAEAHKTDATAVIGFLRVVEAVRPGVIISENVCAARSSASYLMIKSYLSQMSYVIHEIDMGPELTKSMEVRRRYWFIAVSAGLSQVDLSNLPYFEPEYRRIEELLDDIPEDHKMWSDNQYLKDKQKRDAAAGKGFANRCLLTPDDTSIATAPRTYAKRQSTSPFLVRDDGKERLFTPAELCRAHSAPEHLIEGLSDACAYEGLGQSIDFKQGLAVAMIVARDCCGSTVETTARQATTLAVVAERVDDDDEAEAEEANELQLVLFG